MNRDEHMAVLGPLRSRILDCLGGNSRWAPGYWAPPANGDTLESFRTYVQGMGERWGSLTDATSVSLLAAARLLIGDISAAHDIIAHLPDKPVKLDHGAGQCLVAAPQVLRATLPLPADLSDSTRWLAGSEDQTRLKAWLSANQPALRWNEKQAVYVLPPAG